MRGGTPGNCGRRCLLFSVLASFFSFFASAACEQRLQINLALECALPVLLTKTQQQHGSSSRSSSSASNNNSNHDR